MTVSQLIKQLQEALKEVGDTEVVMPTEAIPYDDDDSAWAEIVHVAWGKHGDNVILCDPSLANDFQ